MRVKCLTEEHNTVPRPGLEPRPLDPESSALTRLSIQSFFMCRAHAQKFSMAVTFERLKEREAEVALNSFQAMSWNRHIS